MWARRYILVTVLAWGVIALISAGELTMWAQRTPNPITFAWALASQGPPWLLWALATAPIVALGRRFTLTWPPRLVPLVVHLTACLTMDVVFALVFSATKHMFPWRPINEPLSLELWQGLVGWTPCMLVTYGSVAGIGHALGYAAQVRREQLEKAALATQLVEAQLGALRMQLQPHFLFNTLNSVSMLIRKDERACAVEMIAQLGDVLRSLLRTSSDLESTLAAELDFLRRYLAIEQVRFGERLSLRWTIDDDATGALVPPLILQPLVENSLRHGLWPRATGGELAITARRSGTALELEVSDQGVGLPVGFELARTQGVGLANVQARLDRMYGSASSLEVSDGVACGTVVRLRLPFCLEPHLRGQRLGVA